MSATVEKLFSRRSLLHQSLQLAGVLAVGGLSWEATASNRVDPSSLSGLSRAELGRLFASRAEVMGAQLRAPTASVDSFIDLARPRIHKPDDLVQMPFAFGRVPVGTAQLSTLSPFISLAGNALAPVFPAAPTIAGVVTGLMDALAQSGGCSDPPAVEPYVVPISRGEKARWRHPETGRKERGWLFVTSNGSLLFVSRRPVVLRGEVGYLVASRRADTGIEDVRVMRLG